MSLMSEADQRRVTESIVAAEAKTSGEIVAVVAAESSSYLYAPFLWAALGALFVPWPLIYFTWMSVQWIYTIQLLAFFGLLVAFLPRRMRYRLVPGFAKRAQAHKRAVEQFLAQNMHTTENRTGVLIFVSVAEHYAEVLADSGIEKKVEKGTWKRIVDKLTSEIGVGRPAEGFVAAVEASGALLAEHFPPCAVDANELPNRLIVLN